eukprot:TRINITY_DN48197_c0_g2_i1.p1 TRINITY_DN48197_c0_g2~~TRINITY_DN48197_c0_g2_i1.p1  ORF type:complete len:217 (+),score=22.69 TRINITY_DN48197_c0_g2_i1:52-702(+)
MASSLDRRASSSAQEDDSAGTTIIIQNITSRASPQEVREAVDSLGFAGSYDIIYLPARGGSPAGTHYGYAFINFTDAHYSKLFMRALQTNAVSLRQSNKVLSVSYAKVQGRKNLSRLVRRASTALAAPWFKEQGLAAVQEDQAIPATIAATSPPCRTLATGTSKVVATIPESVSTLPLQPRQKFEANPLSIPINTAYFEEDVYLETLVHEFRLCSL